MNRYVIDTHALYWYLINSPKLSAAASHVFDEADNGQALLYAPSIALAELHYLNKKHNSLLDMAQVIRELEQKAQFVLVPFEGSEVCDFDADSAVPEMHDRIIAGVARRLGVPCVTQDHQITGSGLVAIVW